MNNKPATWFWIGVYAFTAIILMIAVGVFMWLASESRKEAGAGRTANAKPIVTGRVSQERYQLLARFVPPQYQPGPGAAPSREFQRAIQQYIRGDDAGAIPGLRAAAKAQPDSVEARFYLAICLLLTGDRASGIQELRAVIAAGSTSYLERAHFYLAKALIGEPDIPAAKEQLQTAIAMHGDFEKQSQVLLSQIEPAP